MDLPRHVVASGLVASSPSGRILMVQTFNRIGRGLILPGGLVEDGESPADAAVREVAEELGIEVVADRLLSVRHRGATVAPDRPANLQFVFASDVPIPEDAELMLKPDEIAEVHWVERDQVLDRCVAAGRTGMEAALTAFDTDVPIYVDGTTGG